MRRTAPTFKPKTSRIVSRLAAMAVLMAVPIGCQSAGLSQQPTNGNGMTTLVVAGGQDVLPIDAPADGEYVLVVPGPAARLIRTVLLRKGDKIGFVRLSDGTVQALGGDRTYDVTGQTGVAWVQGKTK